MAVANPSRAAGSNGAQRPAVLYGGMPTVNPSVADYLTLDAKTAPRGLDLLMLFNGWAAALLFGGNQTAADALGAQCIIAWQPAPNVQGTANDGTLGNVATGVLDAYLTTSAAAVKAYGKPVIIRLAHEFNGNWTSYGNTKESAAAFIAGWQYVVNFFRAQGVSNVLWCWAPSCWGRRASGPIVDPTPFWPGDAYVDLVGLDGYQNLLNPYVDWPADVFLGNYKQVVVMTDKPVVIAEVGVAEDGRFSKAAWFDQLFALVRDQMPRVVALCYWSRTDKIGTEGDYSLDSSGTNAPALASFKRGVNGIPMATPSGMSPPGWGAQPQPSPARSSPGVLSPAWAPATWKEEAFPRAGAEKTTDFTLISAQLHVFSGPTLRAGVSYSKVGVLIGGTGDTTPTHSWAVLLDQALNVLAVSTDRVAAATAPFQLLTFNLAAAIQRPVDTPVYVGVCWVAAATPTLRGKAALYNTAVQLAPMMTGKSTAGLTDPASLGAAAGALVAPAVTDTLPYSVVG